jgi:hypothetical protein
MHFLRHPAFCTFVALSEPITAIVAKSDLGRFPIAARKDHRMPAAADMRDHNFVFPNTAADAKIGNELPNFC